MPSELNSQIAPLLQPLSINGMMTSSRFVMSPMTRSFCPNGLPGADVAGYYWRRAESGIGYITTEAVGSDHPAAFGDTGLGEKDLSAFVGTAAVEAWRKVVDGVHQAGSKIVPQLWHQGPMRMPGSPPFPEAEAFSPSGYYGDVSKAPDYYRDKAEVLARPNPIRTDAEIADIIDSFARAAEQVRDAGFDGIALHGAHATL